VPVRDTHTQTDKLGWK